MGPRAVVVAACLVLAGCGSCGRQAASRAPGKSPAPEEPKPAVPARQDAGASGAVPFDGPALALGAAHSCLLGTDGRVRCWGSNRFGQLGAPDLPRGEGSVQPTPVAVSFGGAPVVSLAAGAFHTCALLADGHVRCFGHGGYGLLGDGALGGDDVPTPRPVTGVAGVTALSAGEGFTCARARDGQVLCWGRNDHGQLGRGSTTPVGAPGPVTGVEGAVAVAAGRSHACALDAGGEVWCWGLGVDGQVGPAGRADAVPAPVRVPHDGRVVQVAAGGYHTCLRRADGTVTCFGSDDSGQLGSRSGGTLHDRRAAPGAMVGVGDARGLALGARFTCVRRGTGEVACAGYDGHGQLGDGTRPHRAIRKVAEPVAGGTGASRVAAGASHGCALVQGGAAVCWGRNDRGQLGDGTTEDRSRAVPVQAP